MPPTKTIKCAVLRVVCTNVDPALIADQRNFKAKKVIANC